MANKSSSAKAKTKKITAKKTSAAKSTKQSAQKKKVINRDINVLQLRSLHMASAGLFILLALLAGMFMSNDSYQLTIGYLTRDILAEGTVLAPAVRVVYDVEIRWLLVAILTLSAVLPMLYMTYWEKKYAEALTKSRTMFWRWIDFAVTGALMLETVALLSGAQDVMMLKFIGGLVAISFVLSLIAEWHQKFPKPAWSTFTIGVAAAIIPWLLIATYAVSTVIYGAVWSPWYVYALYGVLALGFAAIFGIQFTDYRRKNAAWQQNYLLVERNYIAVNVLTKAAFAVILTLGLLK